jgi:hypothetical protein
VVESGFVVRSAVRRTAHEEACRMIRAAKALPVSLLLLAPAALHAQQADYPPQEGYGIRLEYREFRPTFSGDIQKGFGDQEGTLVDVVDDLGIPDERTFEARGTLQFKQGHKLRGSYTPLDYSGDVDEARRDFDYGQTEFQRFERVLTSLKGGYYSASYEWDFMRGPRGFLGVTLGAKVIDLDATLVAPEQSAREQDTLRAPVPAVGLVTRAYTGRVSVEGEISGMTLGDRGTLIDFDLATRVHVSDRLGIGGGYRYLSIKAKDDRDFGDIRIRGWHFGLEISL